jgi:hypothetical protein
MIPGLKQHYDVGHVQQRQKGVKIPVNQGSPPRIKVKDKRTGFSPS